MGEIARRSRLLEEGYSDHEIRQLYRRHDWRRLGHGCYVRANDYTSADAVARHRLLIESTLATMADDAVVSHESAAVLYGLPIWALALDVVHVTRDRRNGGRIRPTLKVHCAPIDDGVVAIDGRFVTSPARTVVDIGRSVPFEQAVVICDAAVLSLGIAATELAVELERAKRRRGASRARRVIAFMMLAAKASANHGAGSCSTTGALRYRSVRWTSLTRMVASSDGQTSTGSDTE